MPQLLPTRVRPYSTVLRDAFHEAFASRVLWILLGVSTLVLLGLAPLGLHKERATSLQFTSVRDWPGLINDLHDAAMADDPSVGKRVWELAEEPFREAVRESARGEGSPDPSRRTVSTILDTLNELLGRKDFYDEAAWQSVLLDEATQDLLGRERTELDEEELRVLNRGLFTSAFFEHMSTDPDTRLRLTYFGSYLGDPLPIPANMADAVVNGVVTTVMSFFVGTLAVFIAILVTAPMIPQTFEAGAIDLLLSKPISRPLLFLAKFFGGCVFILLNASYFVLGLWLILGLRFDMWKASLLTCIPVFLFLFVIYYSVSALSGVIWKNATVSIVITILFWAVCFTVETAKGIIEQFFVVPEQITELIATPAAGSENEWLAINHVGDLLQWNAPSNHWQAVLMGEPNGPPFVGERLAGSPQYDVNGRRILYLRQPRERPFRFFRAGPTLIEIAWTDGVWQRNTGPAPPRGTQWLLASSEGQPVVITDSKVFRVNDPDDADGENGSDADGENGESKQAKPAPQIFGFKLPIGGAKERGPYESLGPERGLGLDDPFAAARSPAGNAIAVFSNQKLQLLKRDAAGEPFQVAAERSLPEVAQPVQLALASDVVLIAAADGRCYLLNADQLATGTELRPLGGREPERVLASADGNWFAVKMQDGSAAVFDRNGGGVRKLGRISTLAFLANNDLLVADRTNRVTRYEVDTWSSAQQYAPPLDTLQIIHRYLLVPFYTVFPKPGKLGDVVSYLLSEGDSEEQDESESSPLESQPTLAEIRQPVLSSLAFVLVMLGFTCWHVQRMDI